MPPPVTANSGNVPIGMALLNVLVLSVVLGVASFLFGLLPFVVSFSRKNLARLSIFGTGLLLGAAVGVIIPEGIETVYAHRQSLAKDTPVIHSEPPTLQIALALLSGFTLMLIIEQAASHFSAPQLRPNATSLNGPHLVRSSISLSRPLSPTTTTSIAADDLELDIDAEVAALENGKSTSWRSGDDISRVGHPERKDPRLMTLGLIIHSLADGLALGASIASASASRNESPSAGFSGLSFVVFAAIALHKAPASFALSSTLTTHLPPRVVRAHLAAFSFAAPMSAIISYSALTWFGLPTPSDETSASTGIALLFSGGTFLYVATLLTPLSADAHAHAGEPSTAEADLHRWGRLALIICGMFTPAMVAGLVGHGH